MLSEGVAATMDIQDFRQAVSDNLVPMLQATLEEREVQSTAQEALTSYLTPTRLAVKPERNAGYRLVLTRSQKFTPGERMLAGNFIDELAQVVALDAGEYQPDLLRAVQRRVVARALGGETPLLSILQRLETWSSQTYEGQRIVASIGLDSEPARAPLLLDDLWDEPFGPVMTNGFDTLLVVGSDGTVGDFVELSTGQLSRTAPYRMSELANWASGARVAAVLNQRGEILLFQRQSLRFARRGGSWHHYVHDTNVSRMSPPVDIELRRAIYESCLDVSFARSGGGIGVVDHAHRADAATVVSDDDLLVNEATYKARLLSRIISGRGFKELDRRTRTELLSLDGATVMTHTGVILAVGSIIKVPGGSAGGGRTAAARQLSTIGLGVKVSQDGGISGYRDGDRVFQS